MPPNYRGRCRSNPPEEFERREEEIVKAIEGAAQESTVPREIEKIEVLWGHEEPTTEVTIVSPDMQEEDARQIFEKLAADESLRLTVDAVTTLYPGRERDQLSQPSQQA